MMIPNTEEDTATRFMRKTSSKPSKGLPVSLGILCLAGLPINKMKACEMAKSPRTTGIKWKPPRNHEIPKVKRVESRTGSMPTVAKNTPNPTKKAAASVWSRWATITSTRPSSAARKISRLPKYGAIAARLGAKVISARMLIMPPTKLALYASESARLGCPCLVML